jgi:hypothetical protein
MVQRPRKTPATATLRPTNVIPIPMQSAASQPPPADLEPPEAELWTAIVRDYALNDDAALELLGTAMQARARMRRCRAAIDRDGEVIRDRWNVPRAHPLLVAERGARDSFLMAMRQLNLDTGGVR